VSCPFNFSALEEFSIDYNVVTFAAHCDNPTARLCNDADAINNTAEDNDYHAIYSITGITTTPLPDTVPSEHGTIALHPRNLQLKLDSHAAFPTPFALGEVPVSGMQIHEELHINGATSQASFHLESPLMNVCFQLDHLPPVTQQQHDMIDGQLQQAEQIAPANVQRYGISVPLDGEQTVGLTPRTILPSQPFQGALYTENTHPSLVVFGPLLLMGMHGDCHGGRCYEYGETDDYIMEHPQLASLALKFDNYDSSVGNQFGVRACEIEHQTATQSLLATNPEARAFIAHRIAQHQRRLQAVLQPVGLNMRFNFIPLEIADLMIPVAKQCTNDELAQIPRKALSTLQLAAFSVCSFVIGIAATFAALRKKTVSLAGDYHQVSE